MKFKRFTKPEFLRQIGRPLMAAFLSKFATEWKSAGVELPADYLEDDKYFATLTKLAMAPGDIPPEPFEVMYLIEAMANPDGHERLLKAVAEKEIEVEMGEKATVAEVAMRVWLAAPEVVLEKQSELRLRRLASFEYWGSKEPEDQSATFVAPTSDVLAIIARDIDAWCAEHQRGAGTASVVAHVMDGEHWYLVRHGDTYARAAKVEDGKIGVLHYRPAKDDVVVYNPKRDELRIHAGTKGERDLYRATFGKRLFADDEQFSNRKQFTLDPLRTDSADALDVTGIEGIDKIVLTEVKVRWGGAYNRSTTWEADDLVAAAAEAKFAAAVPAGGMIERAVFSVQFTGSPTPRRVEIRPPGVLRLGRHCDAAAVQHWLSEKEFRAVVKPESSHGNNFGVASA